MLSQVRQRCNSIVFLIYTVQKFLWRLHTKTLNAMTYNLCMSETATSDLQ